MNSGPNPSNVSQEAEPTAGPARPPVWLLVLVAMLAFWGMGFLDKHGGGFNPQVYAPYNSIDELDGDRNRPGSVDPSRRGRKVFIQVCAQCHAENGLGNPANRVPPLVHSEWVLAEGPNRLIRIVLNGLQGPVDVDGRQFDSNAMIPWRDTLNDADIAALLSFLRGNNDWGHNASPIAAEQVTRVRAETKDRAGQWTVGELLNVPEN
jgi:mono/diheme cytochrome c family protein